MSTRLGIPDLFDKLNNRPKKCLNYKTPYEAFEELTGVDIKNLLGYALMT
jgi:IS30 family transposase